MKTNRTTVTGTFKADNTVNFKIVETIFTGEGMLDYINTTIAEGTTTEVLYDEANDTDLTHDFFKKKYGKNDFDFICEIN